MDTQGFTLSLSGINFRMDEETQKKIIQEVTDKVIQSIGEKIGKDITNLINEVKEHLSSLYGLPSGKKDIPSARKERSENIIESQPTVENVPEPAGIDDGTDEIIKATGVNPEMLKKIQQDVTTLKGAEKYADFIREMGFKTLYDLLAYKYTHKGAAHFQEQTIIDEIINKSRVKVFVNKAPVKRYVRYFLQPKKARKKKTKAAASITAITRESRFEDIELSKTLQGFLRKANILTINDALLYCNEVKMNTLITDETINKHSMVYQLVKFLRNNGFGTSPMKRFQKKVEENSAHKKASKSDETVADAGETETAEEKEMKSSRFHNLTETDITALYSDVTAYPFAENMSEVFAKYKIQSMFELMFWVCEIPREQLMKAFDLNINALRRFETILAENGFIETVDKLASLSYVYQSKYYHYIRFYRNKIISYKLPLTKFNKNLTEADLDELYVPLNQIEGFSKDTLRVMRSYNIPFFISLIAFRLYGCETAHPFAPEVEDEVKKVINKVHKYKYQRFENYISGLRKYYYKSSLRIQKKKMEEQVTSLG
ncbi:MAG: hypothetical protein LBR49_01300 [Tannerella sp.]|jgi:hypothetical protein|nr:hypothetical protein [Tannerella sp.]